METQLCKGCGETMEPGYDTCWKCGTHLDGSPPDKGFVPANAASGDATVSQRELACLRCDAQMHLVRRMRFHEGTRLWPFLLAELGELFVNRETFDVYACAECGKVEFFLEQQQ